MNHQYTKRIRVILFIFIFILLIGLGLTSPSLAQDPSGVSLDMPQANSQPLPLTNIIQQARLTASDGEGDDYFGWSVALSDNTAVIGAHYQDDNRGAAYIFEKPVAGTWAEANEVAKLTASDRDAQDRFGYAVAINGDTVVISALGKNQDTGTVYLFEKSASGWTSGTETTKLTIPNIQSPDHLGYSVAIHNDTIVVGAIGKDNFAGVAYVFEKPNTGWVNAAPTATLTAANRDASDNFGASIAINDEVIVIGASNHFILAGPEEEDEAGAVYVFEKPASGWTNMTETVKLTPANSQDGDQFGYSLALHNDALAIGATAQDQGAAYVFEKPADSSWANATQTAQLLPTNSDDRYFFGWSIAFNGETIVVGTPDADGQKGAAFQYDKPASGWTDMTETARLTIPDGKSENIFYGDSFGQSVTSSGNTFIIGAIGADGYKGAAYIFE